MLSRRVLESPSKHLRRAFGSIDASDGATVFGSGATTRTEYAGLINATMVRYLDYNDTYISEGRACHPSDHIPALISVAEAEDRTGEELIEAIVLAYEIEGMGLDTGVTWEHDYDYVTWGAYSSVAAAGKLMGLSRTQLKQALGIAGSSNVALSISRKDEVSMWKGAAHAYVVHNAIQACQMARVGMTGPRRVFEGRGLLRRRRESRPRDRSTGRSGGCGVSHHRCAHQAVPVRLLHATDDRDCT